MNRIWVRWMMLVGCLLWQGCDDGLTSTRGELSPVELYGSCDESCGFQSLAGTCWCDDLCEQYGDCCEDLTETCEAPSSCENAEPVVCEFDELIACPLLYQPVCGCDGQTYGNECELEAACVALDHEGECDITICPEIFAPVCGVDGVTYENECQAEGAGVAVDYEGPCGQGSLCGGLAGLVCEGDEYCEYAPGDYCGAADALGACRALPTVCTDYDVPVCGCDDQAYDNVCDAAAAGVSVTGDSFCFDEPPVSCALIYDPVCGDNGITYSNACFASLADVGIIGYGECADILPPPVGLCAVVDCAPGYTCVETCGNGFFPDESCTAQCVDESSGEDVPGLGLYPLPWLD